MSRDCKNTETHAAIAVFDLDGTLTVADTYLAFLLYVLKKQPTRLLRCWYLPFAVLLFKLKLRRNDWLKQVFLTAIVGGMDSKRRDKLVEGFLSGLIENGMRKQGLKVLATHQQRGDNIVLATASLDIYVRKLAQQLDINHIVCSETQRNAADQVTGRLKGKNCYGKEKLRKVLAYIEQRKWAGEVTAYSDHHADLPLLRWAKDPVMVSPTKKLEQTGSAHGFVKVHW